MANVDQAKAQAAFAASVERGWIEEVKAGSFDQKTGTGRARSFLLTNIGPNGDDANAKKTYMRWKQQASECQKTTVLKASTPCTQGEYDHAEI